MTAFFPRLLLLAGLVGSLTAAPTTFDFKDPKGVNAIQFHLDSLLEPIAGTASGITGSVEFDPAAPAATQGRIVVAANSLVVPNSMMKEHLHGEQWLDVAKHPEITFELGQLENVQTTDNITTATAKGRFTLKGVTKELTVPVRLTYLKDAYGRRINRPDAGGDLLVVRSEFTITRADFGVQPGRNEERVDPDVKLMVAIVGGAPKA
jgi:polyisoprenoid-binding protein YceI